MMRENVATTYPDDQSKLSLDKIDTPEERRVADLAELRSYLEERRRSRINVDVDFIGHSDVGILRVGPIVFDLTGISQITSIEPPGTYDAGNDGLSGVRLLGCDTASTTEGRASMTYLKAIIQAPVWGTQRALQADDFQADGLRPGCGDLIEVDDLDLVTPKTPQEVVAGWGAVLPPAVPADDREARLALYDGLFARPAVPPSPPPRPPGGTTPRRDRMPTIDMPPAFSVWLRRAVVRAPWLARARGLLAFAHVGLIVPPPRRVRPAPSRERPLRVEVLARGWALRIHHDAADGSTLILPVNRKLLTSLLPR